MPGLTTYSSKLIDAILRGQLLAFPANGVSVGLHTADPTPDCTVSEVVTASYVRMAIPVASWNPSVNGVCTLNTEVLWPVATEDWGNISHVSFWDENGNSWFRGLLSSPRLVLSGSTFHIDSSNAILGIQ